MNNIQKAGGFCCWKSCPNKKRFPFKTVKNKILKLPACSTHRTELNAIRFQYKKASSQFDDCQDRLDSHYVNPDMRLRLLQQQKTLLEHECKLRRFADQSIKDAYACKNHVTRISNCERQLEKIVREIEKITNEISDSSLPIIADNDEDASLSFDSSSSSSREGSPTLSPLTIVSSPTISSPKLESLSLPIFASFSCTSVAPSPSAFALGTASSSQTSADSLAPFMPLFYAPKPPPIPPPPPGLPPSLRFSFLSPDARKLGP